MVKNKNALLILLLGLGAVVISSCVTTHDYLHGVSAEGEKIYLGPVPIENTEAFKTFYASQRSEVQKQQYLFQRLKEAPKDLEYFHEGNWYGWLEAYRGGMWLVRNRYQKDQDTRDFLKKFVWRSETSRQLHLIRYPDGTVQVAYFVLLNELDLLEEKLKTGAI